MKAHKWMCGGEGKSQQKSYLVGWDIGGEQEDAQERNNVRWGPQLEGLKDHSLPMSKEKQLEKRSTMR